MQRTAALIALTMVAMGLVPMAAGNHLSVGNQDAVGMSAQESPGEESVSDELFGIGTTPTAECYDNEGDEINESSAGDVAQKAADGLSTHSFCGRLDYNPGDHDYGTVSPPDQDIRGDVIDTWDVQYASYVGNYGLSTCEPWCEPGGVTVYRALHDTLADQGLADDGETADSEDDGGWQEYAVNTLYPNALIVAQQQTGLWDGNGWAHTLHDQQFIGFLEDTEGQPIDADRLQEEIHANADVPEDSIPQICGFTPDMEVTIDAPQASFCEVLFKWNEPNEEGAGPAALPEEGINSDDYTDACESPAYVCGASQPAWYAQLVCKTFFSLGGVNPGSFGCAGGDYASVEGEDGPAWSDNDYDIWHWVVAPAPSACSGDAEPGFLTEAGAGASNPYLAHDLDVYSPAATAADEAGTENAASFARDSVAQTAADTVAEVQGSAASDEVVPAPEQLAPSEVQKKDRVEPNADGDTSQSNVEIPRDAETDDCDVLREGTEEVYDPWVDVIDNEVILDAAGEPMGGGFDLYLTGDDTQDASNRPGYGQYFTAGKVGVFADKNDDGDYDQVGSGDKVQSVNDAGAYEMIWDVHLNQTEIEDAGEAKVEHMQGGCTPGFSDFDLSEEAAKAGYGPHTGLLQVIYLNEPTYLFNWDTSEPTPFTGGNNAFVFLSDGFEQLHAVDDTRGFVEDLVDDALQHVPAEDPNIVYPHELTGSGITDFAGQCAEATGGFTSSWGFLHTCAGSSGSGSVCEGDTVVTQYTFEVLDPELGGGESNIPLLDVTGDGEGYEFEEDINTWTDVDPLDGDPARNNDDCSRPAHHVGGHDNPCGFDEGGHHDA